MCLISCCRFARKGKLQDNLGHKVNFRNTVIIMTSNLGSQTITGDGAVGFLNDNSGVDRKNIRSTAMSALKKAFRPEFINRIDEILVFETLKKSEVRSIVDILLAEVQMRLQKYEITLEVNTHAKELIIKKGYNTRYGARPLRRVIQREIEDTLSTDILHRKYDTGSRLILSTNKNAFVFRKKSEKPLQITAHENKDTVITFKS